MDEGLIAAPKEATELFRHLAKKNPEAFRAEFAGSLNNLSSCLSKAGHLERALVAIEEGVYIYRDLDAAYPDAFRDALAMSLNNLSNRLSQLKRLEEALVAIQEQCGTPAPRCRRPDAFVGTWRCISAISGTTFRCRRHQEARTGYTRP